jgi:hypothetical protein
MGKISKKIALKLINKLPIPDAQKDEVKKGVLKELDEIKNMNSKALQQRLKEG